MILDVPIFILDAETQIMFNDCFKNCFILSFDSWRSTDIKTVETQLENQVDIGSAQNNIPPKPITVTHQTAARIGVPNKASNVAVFDNLDVRKFHVDADGVLYSRDGVSIEYASNDYVDKYRDLILFSKEYVGKELFSLCLIYIDMRNKYPIQVIDLRVLVDHSNPKRIQLRQEYSGATDDV